MRKTFAIIMVIGICLLVIAAQAGAEQYTTTSGDYNLWTLMNSGSMIDQPDTTSTHKLTDLKGYPFNFYTSTDGTYTLSTGLGSLVGSGEAPVGPTTIEVTDNGQIQKTWIERSGSDVIIHWTYADTTVMAVDVWQLATPSQESYKVYDRTGMAWSKIDTITKPVDSKTVAGIVKNGWNYYYRVIPQGALPITGETTSHVPYNSITVGKIDIVLTPGLNLVAVPLILTSAVSIDPLHIDCNLSTAMEGQLGSGDDFYNWNGTDLALSSNSGTWSNPTTQVVIGQGFWINTGSVKTVTVGGILANNDFTDTIQIGLNLLGYPFPLSNLAIGEIGFTTGTGDDFYYWSDAEKALKLISNSGSWPTTNPNLKLILGLGNWFNTGTSKPRSLLSPNLKYQE